MGNPIYLGKQYPEEVLNTAGTNLTALTDEELAYINGEYFRTHISVPSAQPSQPRSWESWCTHPVVNFIAMVVGTALTQPYTGTSDFWSFDPYTAGFATSPPNGIDACAANSSDPNWPNCVINTNVQQDGWLNGQASYAYAYIAPQYVRQQFGYVWDTFHPSGILVAEFGFNPFMEWAKVSRSGNVNTD